MAADHNTTVNEYSKEMSVAELKKAAKEKEISGYSAMNKSQLLETLNNGD